MTKRREVKTFVPEVLEILRDDSKNDTVSKVYRRFDWFLKHLYVFDKLLKQRYLQSKTVLVPGDLPMCFVKNEDWFVVFAALRGKEKGQSDGVAMSSWSSDILTKASIGVEALQGDPAQLLVKLDGFLRSTQGGGIPISFARLSRGEVLSPDYNMQVKFPGMMCDLRGDLASFIVSKRQVEVGTERAAVRFYGIPLYDAGRVTQNVVSWGEVGTVERDGSIKAVPAVDHLDSADMVIALENGLSGLPGILSLLCSYPIPVVHEGEF